MGGKYFSALTSKGLGDSKELNLQAQLGYKLPKQL